MSLAINTVTPEGIVLAADSRQSFRNQKGVARIGSDNASKLFQLNNRIGIAITGLAFLSEDGTLKNISKFIDEFKTETDGVDDLELEQVAVKLHSLFSKKYNWQEQLEKLPAQIEANLKSQGCEVIEIKKENYLVKFRFKDRQGKEQNGVGGIDTITILVSGYDKDGSHLTFICSVPGEIQEKRSSKKKGNEYGASWIGQIDVVSRIVLGFDGRIGNTKFMNEAIQKFGSEEISTQLRDLEYSIQWGTMTLQDAVDFCTLIIQTTAAIQRFSDGILAEPGDMPGVGGPIDVAIITPREGFKWIKQKQLGVDGV